MKKYLGLFGLCILSSLACTPKECQPYVLERHKVLSQVDACKPGSNIVGCEQALVSLSAISLGQLKDQTERYAVYDGLRESDRLFDGGNLIEFEFGEGRILTYSVRLVMPEGNRPNSHR